MKINFKDNIPIYIQILNLIKKKIVCGDINGGDKLPSVRELASELKVNPNTIQRTYQELERDGLTYTQRGMGRFVTENKEIINTMKKNMARDVIEKFLSDMKQLGFDNLEIAEIVSSEINEEGEKNERYIRN